MPVSFEVTANNFDSRLFKTYATLEIGATTADGEGDVVVRTLPVLRSEIFEMVSDIGVANGNMTLRKLELTGVQKDRSEILFQVSSTLFGQVIDGIENLLTYPYGCVEQITSAIIPHVAVKNIHDSLGLPYDLKEKKIKRYNTISQEMEDVSIQSVLTEYVMKVMSYEYFSGGFRYWSNGGYADFRMTAYVMKVLRGISDIGISIDPGLVKRTNDYLKTRYIADYRE